MSDLVTLAECLPGVFDFEGTLGFKTEYGATVVDENGAEMPGHKVRWIVSNWPDAYCLESGEFFWGGTKKHEDRAKLMVRPVEVSAVRYEVTNMSAAEVREVLGSRHSYFEPGQGEKAIEEIVNFLIRQDDEPQANGARSDSARLHYWRDKAITAAEKVKALLPQTYPTEDAYMRVCRALHWRTDQIRAMGGEPVAIPDDAEHYPPDGYFDELGQDHRRQVVEEQIDRMGWDEIRSFQERISQDVCEDAGSFILRKIKRLFGIKHDPVLTYQEAARARFKEADRTSPGMAALFRGSPPPGYVPEPHGGGHEPDFVPMPALEPIPELVYWSGEDSNFYGQVSRRGQGQEFFDKWYPRRDEFPTSAHEDDKGRQRTHPFKVHDRVTWLRFDDNLEPYMAVGEVVFEDNHQVVAKEDGRSGADQMAPSALRFAPLKETK